MLDILITIVGGAAGLGFALVIVGGWLGESSPLAAPLWFIGAAIVVVTLPLLVVLLVAFALRWAGRALGILAVPPRSTEPEPGWEGWDLTLDSVDHEVWIPAVGPTPEVLVDGAWVRTRASRASRSSRASFPVGGHLGEIAASIDWGTAIRAAPLAIGGALLGFPEGGAPPMRYTLLVDGTPRPRAEHRVFGASRGSRRAGDTEPAAAPQPGIPASSQAGMPAAPPPGRHIRLDPPGR